MICLTSYSAFGKLLNLLCLDFLTSKMVVIIILAAVHGSCVD